MKKTIAILGYGSQGSAIAQNLRDSGYNLIIGLPPKSKSRRKANKDGFKPVMTISNAVKRADVICFAFPDHLHGRVYDKEIKPYLLSGKSLWFLHGMSVHFGFVNPPEECDVFLVAPHAPGITVREKYLIDRSLSAFYSVNQDFSGNAKQTTLAIASGCGFQKKRLVSTSFEHEAIGDLFGEQAVLCGGLASLIKNGFDTLVENGFPSENAYLEVAYQLDLIIKLIKEHGINGMFERISIAAQYGSAETGPKIIDKETKQRMKNIFEHISSGEFPTRLNSLKDKEITKMKKNLKKLSSPEFEKAARKYSPK